MLFPGCRSEPVANLRPVGGDRWLRHVGAAHGVEQRSRTRVVRRLPKELHVVGVAVRSHVGVPDPVVEGLGVRGPGRLVRLGGQRRGQVHARARAGGGADEDVVAALVRDAWVVQVGRPGRAILAYGRGIRDVLGGRARRGEVEDVEVVGPSGQAMRKDDLGAVGRPGGVAVLEGQPGIERAGDGSATHAVCGGAQEELGVAETGPPGEDDPAVRTREDGAGRSGHRQHRCQYEKDNDQPRARVHRANLTRGHAARNHQPDG